MNLIFLLLPAALVLGFIFFLGFVWATQNGQYDDLDTPPQRILTDDEKEQTANERRST